ncbi:MAG: hypothetical protein AAGA48_33995 [Myxococcota bacterium]
MRSAWLVGLAIGCGPPAWFETIPTQAPTGPEVCNGRDDDGDGIADEDGALLCDDGDACTVGRCAGSKGCVQSIAPDRCVIDGRCMESGATAPGEVCTICDPRLDQTAWSFAGADVSCDDGEVCTTNDRCDGEGRCRGDGIVANADPFEPNDTAAHDTARVVYDDETQLFLLEATLDLPDDVDQFRYTLTDANQCCVGPCFGSTKQPQAHATLTGAASEVCLQVVCPDGPPMAVACLSGQQVGDDTCCDSTQVTMEHDCTAFDDTVDVVATIIGPGDACGDYQVRLGNLDSGCGF